MIALRNNNEREIALLFEKFAEEYRDKYPVELWEFIENKFWEHVISCTSPDVLMQVYSEIGVESPDGNFYKEHIRKIKESFDIRGNILDVGSGLIPSFANLLAYEQQKIGKGTVTIYEPLLLKTEPKYSNMKLYKKEFTSRTNIKEFDLITGILPCDATETIIEQACRNRKDFYIAMCGCTHFNFITWGMPISSEAYQEYVINQTKILLEKYNNGELVVERLDDKYDIKSPILRNRRNR